ncbi:uncharacterized protein LOC131255318 [Magnolia sinica]|uniref:uncharacterized protein LOC131255318 n=1 Tax=Magnolia sinica TaxID=86752 RepID=UPI00265A9F97|nr:uncharacterized protein LOC131255318 [Magnolia sinica]
MGNPGKSGGGGIGRDSFGAFLFAFSHGYGIGTNNRAELGALHDTMSTCINRGYNQVFLESDSKCVVDAFTGKSSPVWKWKYWWTRIKNLRTRGIFVIFHIPREGNGPADALAKTTALSQQHMSYLSFTELPHSFKGLYNMDALGLGSLKEI